MTLEEAIVISIRKYYDNHKLGESDTPMVYTNKFFDEQEEELLKEEEAPTKKSKTVVAVEEDTLEEGSEDYGL